MGISIHIHYTRKLLICQDSLAVFTVRTRKIVILYRIFISAAEDFGNMQAKKRRKKAFGGVKTRFLRYNFLEKGLHFPKVYGIIAGYGSGSVYLPVAQLDSASDSDSEGRRFESFRVGQRKKPRRSGLFLLVYW